MPAQAAGSGERTSIDEAAFCNLAKLVRNRAGVLLKADRSRFVSDRLRPVARSFGFRDTAHLLAELVHPDEELARAVTEAVTSQDTWFFRDETAFEYVRTNIFPALVEARKHKGRLRIWSAGCASGQEAFSLAMLIEESGYAERLTVDIVASDLSADAIARCKAAVYAPFEIERGLSSERRLRFFAGGGESWRAIERLRRAVAFYRFNLLDHFGWLGEIDLILCRNVLMYLAPEERFAVLEKFHRMLAQDGSLVLGSCEVCDAGPFRPVAGPRGVFTRA